ncbi:DNA-processing protein DprA [Aerococcus christensenii]|uniref:DNA-processing protein DprA n=1 Tax=Aerococcus christensenii TaxID=87541 RepID=UPI000762E83E|nr:DNA-processing protein DprA [Aerococcus christensenii]AMB93078.1 hypothetical protein AWM71_07265 [Aerococcus christensenii]
MLSEISSVSDDLERARQLLIYLTESGLVGYMDRVSLFKEALEKEDLFSLVQRQLGEKRYFPRLMAFFEDYSFSHYLKEYQKRHIHPITYFDWNYPPLLQESYRPALVLFTQGQWQWLHTPCLSVVGSRKASQEAKQVIDYLITPCLQELTIVSGLAYGVDVQAHRTAIEGGGQTIAVIGTGLAHVYPSSHQEIQQLIAKNYLLVSILPLYAGVKPWHFPYRNETIAGLSSATLVIEAKKRSGSLITANYALQANREVMAVPGSVLDECHEGCNQLIQAGALPVLQAEDILEQYHLY